MEINFKYISVGTPQQHRVTGREFLTQYKSAKLGGGKEKICTECEMQKYLALDYRQTKLDEV